MEYAGDYEIAGITLEEGKTDYLWEGSRFPLAFSLYVADPGSFKIEVRLGKEVVRSEVYEFRCPEVFSHPAVEELYDDECEAWHALKSETEAFLRQAVQGLMGWVSWVGSTS